MTKLTVITDNNGNVTAIGQGHLSQKSAKAAAAGQLCGGILPGPNQQLHEIEISEELGKPDWQQLVAKVTPHLKHKA